MRPGANVVEDDEHHRNGTQTLDVRPKPRAVTRPGFSDL
jgi:hypothetical protein